MCPIHTEKQRPQKRTEVPGNSSEHTDRYASPSYAPSGISNRAAVMVAGMMLGLSGRGKGMRHLGKMMGRGGLSNPFGTDMLKMSSMMSRDFSTTAPHRPPLRGTPPGAESATNRYLNPFNPQSQGGAGGSRWSSPATWGLGVSGTLSLALLYRQLYGKTDQDVNDYSHFGGLAAFKEWQPPQVHPELLQEYAQLFEEHGIPMGEVDPGRKTAQSIIMSSPQGLWSDPVNACNRDTGGQPEYVLQIAKQCAEMGRNVIIIARDFKIGEEDTRRNNRTDNVVVPKAVYGKNKAYFNEPPRIEQYTENGPGKGNVWLIRVPSTGGPVREHQNYDSMSIRSPSPYGTMTDRGKFVWKTDLWTHLPELSEGTTAIAQLFGADIIVGNWADGMGVAANVAARLGIPAVHIAHDMAVNKINSSVWIERIAMEIKALKANGAPEEKIKALEQKMSLIQKEFLPYDANLLLGIEYVPRPRLATELYSYAAGNYEIENTQDEYETYLKYFPNFSLTTPESETSFAPAGAAPIFYRERGDYNYTAEDEASYRYKPGFAEEQAQIGKGIMDQYGLKEKKYIIFWGRKSKDKGADAMVDTIAELRKMGYKDMKALIIYAGTDAVVDRARQLGLKINEKDDEGGPDLDIIMVGPKKHPAIKVLIDNALAYTGMQIKEAFGMSVGEAFATGTPVLISESAGIAKFLHSQEGDKKYGYVVDRDNPGESAKILANLIEDPGLWESIGKGGQEFARQFTWEGITKKELTIFDRLRAEGTSAKPSSQALLPTWRGSSWSWDGTMVEHLEGEAKRFFAEFPVDSVSKDRRFVVSVSGNKGAGEFADLLARMMGRAGLVGQAIPVDADLDNPLSQRGLHYLLMQAKHKGIDEVGVPSYTSLLDRRYPYVPVYLRGVDVIVLESRQPVRSSLVDFHFELRDISD